MIRKFFSLFRRPKPVPVPTETAGGIRIIDDDFYIRADGKLACRVCGGNCGQCGNTGRLGNIGVSMASLVSTLHGGPPIDAKENPEPSKDQRR